MSNLTDLYNQVLKDHRAYPRNRGLLDDPNYLKLKARNPSCGDDVTVEVKIENGIIKDIRHDEIGCAICASSASVMSEVLIGKSVEEASEVIQDFYSLIKGELPQDEERLGDAIVYVNIHNFPPRAKCATLAWRAVDAVINSKEDSSDE